jgi:polysaccharide biosynthesis transport protein
MSANVSPALRGPQTAVEPFEQPPLPVPAAGRDDGGAPSRQSGGLPIARILGAIGRYKWLVLLVLALGSVGGVVATRYIDPEYQVQSTVLLTSGQNSGTRGPIRDEQQFDPQGWIDLLRSYSIADSVVLKLALYVQPNEASDAPLFRDFSLDFRKQRFYPGKYTLKIAGPRYTLSDGIVINETGIVGDSIGRTAGFAWRPSRTVLGRDRTIKFTVRTPRETSVEISRRMGIGLARGSNIIILQLRGTVQQKPAETLNAWGEQFVRIATDLKNTQTTQFSRILNAQRSEAAERLTRAERDLQSFRVQAITKPSEGTPTAPGGGGLEIQHDPVLNNYFVRKLELDNMKRDREALERVAAQVTPTSTPVEALLSVHLVSNDPVASPLRTSLNDYMTREAQLRLLRQTYTDSFFTVKPRIAEIQALQARIVEQLGEVITQIRQREATLGQSIANSEKDLEGIPSRSIAEEALRRDVDNAAQLYTTLQQRYAEVDLAEKSTTPDVRVLDQAVMPLAPTANTAPRIIALAIGGSLAAGLALAVLLDLADRRFRYPSQITGGLGLQILGVVPEIDPNRRQTPEKIAQTVEAFRSLRMNVRYACAPARRVTVSITSPGAGDGKSLVASNLALSFAEGGWRTVLVDGDVRRGQLNVTFDLPQAPGLVEHLEGTSLLSEILYPTNHENLALLPSGGRHRRAPELLATPRMQELIAALARDFDAIIVDTPPLGAGTDAYSLAAATGNLAIVVRSGVSDLRLGEAKLRVLDNLPVRALGAVLNGISTDGGAYQYYSYDPEYAMVEEGADQPQLTAGSVDR